MAPATVSFLVPGATASAGKITWAFFEDAGGFAQECPMIGELVIELAGFHLYRPL